MTNLIMIPAFGCDERLYGQIASLLPADVLVYAIRMQGTLAAGAGVTRRTELAGQRSLIFGGVPVRHSHIDAMQFVMRRNLWLAEGGWSDKRANGDGFMYESFAQKYGYRTVGPILGEHY